MNTTEPITTGTDLLRAALRSRGHIGFIARDLNVSTADLNAFTAGSKTLKLEVLHGLTKVLFHDYALYDPTVDRLRKKNVASAPLCTAHPPAAVGTPYVPHSGIGPQLVKPEKVKPTPRVKPGWSE